jgi:glutathione S-transferase
MVRPRQLLPPPRSRTNKLTSSHQQLNRNIVPTFYRYLQAQELDKQIEHAEELKSEISKIVDASHPHGPFFLGPHISFVDVQFAPWMLRLSRVLKPYRGWPDPELGSRWGAWLEAVENDEAVRATTSEEELYLDSYERYAGTCPFSSSRAVLVKCLNGKT